MSVATSTAIIAGSAIAAGAGVAGAAIASHGTTDAAHTQADATQKALDLQKQMYEQQRSDLTPYRTAGSGAVGALAYGLGIPGYENGPPAGMGTTNPGGLASNAGAASAAAAQDALAHPENYTGASRLTGPLPGGSSMLGNGGQVNINPYFTGGQQAGQQMAGGLVTLKAPDGSTRQFQANDPNLAHYLQQGAQQVSA